MNKSPQFFQKTFRNKLAVFFRRKNNMNAIRNVRMKGHPTGSPILWSNVANRGEISPYYLSRSDIPSTLIAVRPPAGRLFHTPVHESPDDRLSPQQFHHLSGAPRSAFFWPNVGVPSFLSWKKPDSQLAEQATHPSEIEGLGLPITDHRKPNQLQITQLPICPVWVLGSKPSLARLACVARTLLSAALALPYL